MILAAGLTPAWQHILVFDDFCVGEVNRSSEVYWTASGKVLNVGIALHRLGAETRVLAPIGGAPLTSIDREFESSGMSRRWVEISGTTRVCTTLLDRGPAIARDARGKKFQATELVENANSLAPGEYDAYLEAYAEEASRAEVVVLTGSLPADTPPTFYRELLERTQGRAIIDARGDELLAALERKPFLVKPNREELARTLRREIVDSDDLRRGIEELHRLGAEWVVVSQGKGELWVSSRSDGLWVVVPPEVESINPIGCGDCLAAGIAWGIHEGLGVIDAARIGVGAALQNLGEILPSRLDIETVKRQASRARVRQR